MQERNQNNESVFPTPLSMDREDQAQSQPSRHLPPSQLLHDLNQPLAAINNYAQAGSHLINNGKADPALLQELFSKIVVQSSRAAVLSQELGKALKNPLPDKDPS